MNGLLWNLHQLFIESATEEDAGRYVCQAEIKTKIVVQYESAISFTDVPDNDDKCKI